MFQVKICGITSPEDALLAAEAGADAIGLNFYEQSPRYVTPERAKEISQTLCKKYEQQFDRLPKIIGVFVSQSGMLDFVATTFDTPSDPIEKMSLELWKVAAAVDLGGFQLHGDEPPELILDLNMANDRHGDSWLMKWMIPGPLFPIIRAFRCSQPNLLPASDYLRRCVEIGDELKAGGGPSFAEYPVLPQAVLLDAYQPGAYGGTGQVVDWNVVRNERDMLMGLPVILAGGLTPENVAEAIATARPDAVDVSSGVESAPGKKDPEKVRRFVAEAKRAFAALTGK